MTKANSPMNIGAHIANAHGAGVKKRTSDVVRCADDCPSSLPGARTAIMLMM
jgi:hypothetical protein